MCYSCVVNCAQKTIAVPEVRIGLWFCSLPWYGWPYQVLCIWHAMIKKASNTTLVTELIRWDDDTYCQNASTGNFCSKNAYELAIVLVESLRHKLCLPRHFLNPLLHVFRKMLCEKFRPYEYRVYSLSSKL